MTLAMIGGLHGASQGRHEEALPYFEQAVAIARERDDEMREAHALSNMAISYTGLGRFAESVEASRRAIELRRGQNDRRSPAFNLDNLGDAYYEMGEYEQAADAYAEALAIVRELGDSRGEAIYLANLTRAREQLIPSSDTQARAELTATARRALEALASMPDTECQRVRDSLRKAFPDLDTVPKPSA
ncbi:MAG: tetratricopeptide repeat protein [Micromonosporaceae bacterium]